VVDHWHAHSIIGQRCDGAAWWAYYLVVLLFDVITYMGGTTSLLVIPESDSNDIIQIQERLGKKYAVPLDVQVAHYTPSIFPLVPMVNDDICRLCADSWKLICNKREKTESGVELNGITLFYNDFYERLELVDENKKIESVLSAHSTGLNKIAEKGAIIIRIINYALSIKKNDEQTQFRLYNLGKAHTKRAIRPYMYSIFVQTLLYTISNQLGLYATHEVMEAWANVFSFIMKSMLPPAIKGQTLETEICINSRTEFSSDNVKAQVQEIKYERDKAISSARSHMTGRSGRSIHTTHSLHVGAASRPQSGVGGNSVYMPKLPLVKADDDDTADF